MRYGSAIKVVSIRRLEKHSVLSARPVRTKLTWCGFCLRKSIWLLLLVADLIPLKYERNDVYTWGAFWKRYKSYFYSKTEDRPSTRCWVPDPFKWCCFVSVLTMEYFFELILSRTGEEGEYKQRCVPGLHYWERYESYFGWRSENNSILSAQSFRAVLFLFRTNRLFCFADSPLNTCRMKSCVYLSCSFFLFWNWLAVVVECPVLTNIEFLNRLLFYIEKLCVLGLHVGGALQDFFLFWSRKALHAERRSIQMVQVCLRESNRILLLLLLTDPLFCSGWKDVSDGSAFEGDTQTASFCKLEKHTVKMRNPSEIFCLKRSIRPSHFFTDSLPHSKTNDNLCDLVLGLHLAGALQVFFCLKVGKVPTRMRCRIPHPY